MDTSLTSFTSLPGLTVVLAACIGCTAFAQAPATPVPATRAGNGLKALDTNKDGQLSREELKAFLDAHKGQAKK